MPHPDGLTVDADIRRARTLPGAAYHDPDLYRRVVDEVLARAWHVAAEAAVVAAPGQVYPFTLLEGALDEPVVLTRDHDGRLHALSNVCTHRANLVVDAPACVPGLRCGYHGRRFGLDGRFQSMPEFQEAADFPTPADDLPRVAAATWGPLVFAGLAPAHAFADWIAPVAERLAWLPVDDLRLDPAACRDYLVAANWALVADNYLEGFHIPFVHAGLNAALDFPAYRTLPQPLGVLQVGVGAPGEPAFAPPAGHPDHGLAVAAYYFWCFPATTLNFYPWGLSVNALQPLGPGRTRVRYLTFAWPGQEAARHRGAGADLDTVEREDDAVVEAVARGVRSRLYARGRYSPRQEVGVHHFHRLLAAWLADPPAGLSAPGSPAAP